MSYKLKGYNSYVCIFFQNYGITELLVTMGIKSEDKLRLIVDTGFRRMTVGQGGVKLNSLINVQESIIVVQSGEVKISIQDGSSFQVSKIVKEGEVIYSKLAVINYMLNFKSNLFELLDKIVQILTNICRF